MRASLTALLPLALLVACSQAPVQQSAPAQAAPVTATPPAADATPPPAPAVAPPPQVQPPAPVPVPAAPQPVQEVPVDKDHREVLIHTNYGDITLQLDAAKAPITAKHFLTYVKERYFDGSAFYRVMPGFVIQAGDYSADMDYRPPTHKNIPFEKNSLINLRGSVAMAHLEPDSGNAAFFINLADNTYQLAPFGDNPGYAVFAQVVAGMDVVDKIAAVKTHSVTLVNAPAPYDDVPVKAVKILKVTLLPMPVHSKP